MSTDVLVIGAGPTGLTLAVDLARRGIAVRIVDAAPGPLRASKGKGLQPRTQEVFDDLGIIDAIRAAGAAYPPMRAYGSGDQAATVVWEGAMAAARPPAPDVPYPSVLMVPQWRTEQILAARLREFGVEVEYGVEVTDVSQEPQSATAAGISAKYLVGADGGRSAVRRALDVKFLGETFESERMALADVQIAGLSRDYWHIWGDLASEQLHLGLCPLPGTEDFQLTAPLAADEEPDLTLEGVQKLVVERSGRTDLNVSAASWHSLYRVNIRLAERYRVGRAFLAGDAAHAHSPAGGQGLNTGVQDAYNLGWKLAAVLAGAPETLLDSYHDERLPIAAEVLGLSTLLLRSGGVAGDPSEEVPRRGRDTDQLDLCYPDSALSVEARRHPGRPAPGDRAPDAPLVGPDGRDVRLFDLFRGPHPTVLEFLPTTTASDYATRRTTVGGGATAVTILSSEARTERAVAGGFLDREGHAFTAYGIDPAAGGLAVVRPDGYLGLLADAEDTAALARYLLY
jgi:2-polyprenyl-6-methoxyphenol hydroxylase-like FAD-dependent oxidoreductase